jgi:hypothetical protein
MDITSLRYCVASEQGQSSVMDVDHARHNSGTDTTYTIVHAYDWEDTECIYIKIYIEDGL